MRVQEQDCFKCSLIPRLPLGWESGDETSSRVVSSLDSHSAEKENSSRGTALMAALLSLCTVKIGVAHKDFQQNSYCIF